MAYPSEKLLPRLTFEQLLQRVERQIQNAIPNFVVEASNQPVLEALLAYFSKNWKELPKGGQLISLKGGHRITAYGGHRLSFKGGHFIGLR